MPDTNPMPPTNSFQAPAPLATSGEIDLQPSQVVVHADQAVMDNTTTESIPPNRVPPPPKTTVWGTDFARLTMQETVDLADRIIQSGEPEMFVTANLNYLMLCEQHPQLREVNHRAAAVIADGHPIVLRSRWGRTPLPCRVAGSDLIVELARLASEQEYRIYLLGAADGVAQAAANELIARFPKLRVAGCYAPPFRPLTNQEHQGMLEQIRAAKPDMLLVAFGQPKGETWILENMDQLGVPLSIQLGASFDFLAGTANRAPWIWQRLGCEWLYRALSDPRRLVPRYWANAKFLCRQLATELLTNQSDQPAALRFHQQAD